MTEQLLIGLIILVLIVLVLLIILLTRSFHNPFIQFESKFVILGNNLERNERLVNAEIAKNREELPPN